MGEVVLATFSGLAIWTKAVVAISSSSKLGHLLRADWFAGFLVVAAVIALHLTTDVIATLELRFYDFASASSARAPSSRIAIIAIDDQSIATIGPWPWPRNVHARLIDQLAAAKAKTIVYTASFFEPQLDRGLSFIRQIKQLSRPDDAKLAALIAQAEATLDSDGQLASSIKNAGNVVIASVFRLGEPQGKPDAPLPAFALKSALDENTGFSVAAIKTRQPIESLGTAAAGVGHLNQVQDVDGAVRQEALLVNYYGKAVPSIALLAALKSLDLTAADLKLKVGESVQIGKLQIKTDGAARMLPQFYKAHGGKPAFAVDSFYDVFSGKIPASMYANKIVVIGATAAAMGTQFPMPGNPALSSAEVIANVISSILNQHFFVQPGWGAWATLGVFLLVAAYIVVALPRLSAGLAALITFLLLAALLGIEFSLLSGAALWFKLVFPAALLPIGYLALMTQRFLVAGQAKTVSNQNPAGANRMLGLALQGQGQLDMAFDRLKQVPLGDSIMDNLYSLGLEFERGRQFNQAHAVFEHMAAYKKDYKDLKLKLNRARNLSETAVSFSTDSPPVGAVTLAGGAVENTTLGRYQIEKTLGKGAMGVVYLGHDPRIGRVVAIKTMALAKEFEGQGLVDARERFFREAETAGRLQHQNIVTIFDVGEEHDLAYIAMEFLKGKDLVDFCKSGRLLPIATVLSIVARVADALAFAHRQHVVHRDIKPANVMYEVESDTVKVTDFGIARITDSSQTKTGLVLGTPSFMSPEQLAGKKVDGRSDLYSLGVMLFQMLTGGLPFRGQSMAELMSRIAKQEAPDIRMIRADLPASLAHLIAKALGKLPEARYQDGDQLARELRAILIELKGDAALAGPISATAPDESNRSGISAMDIEI